MGDQHTFHQLDVFTRDRLGGNPLAVFPDATGLSADTMQKLAREMNLSETTFVTPSDDATRRVRFFTPTAEIPLAGHPTIGTWWLLAEQGLIDLAPDDVTEITQATGRGVLPVEITMRQGTPRRVVMTQALPEFMDVVRDVGALASALGGVRGSVDTTVPSEVVSTALPQLIVPMTSLDALTGLRSGGAGNTLVDLLRTHGTDCAMCYALTPDERTARCRMFAPGLGVPEDPATGSAAGALGAHLVERGRIAPENGVATMTFAQGGEIGRTSTMHVSVTVNDDGAITRVTVGGEAVRVITGQVFL